jgi:TolB-like protein
MLAGCKAFEGKNTRQTLEAIVHDTPAWEMLPAATPPAIRTLLGRCLQKDRDRRLHSIADARIELDEALHPLMAPQQVPTAARPASSEVTAPPTGSQSTLSYLTRLGPYSVVEWLGAGGFAEVYRAWDRRLGCDVALKVLRPGLLRDEESRADLRREAEVLRKVTHPSVAAWHDFGSEDDLDYLVMELVAGDALASKLKAGALPEPEVARLGAQIAAGLAAVHDAGILHGDLKAGNVLVTPEGRVKVIDFGLARHIGVERDGTLTGAATGTGVTGTGVTGGGVTSGGITGGGITGTSSTRSLEAPLEYRAPELLAGADPSPSSDLYSLGVLLYWMATGQRPFREETVADLTQAILHQPPGRPRKLQPGLSPELEAVIEQCLEKDPQQRASSAHEVAEALAELIPAAPLTTTMALQRLRGSSRRRTAWAAGLALLALAVVLIVWMMMGGPPASRAGGVDSLVVMPTRVLGSETAEYLTDAIPNSLSTYLSRVKELETKVPPSSASVERVGGGLEKVAQAYGVSTMVLSTVTEQDHELVLNVQLVDAGSRNLLWSQEYRRASTAYGELMEVAADGIREAARPGASAVSGTLASGRNAQAEALLQQGLYYSNLYRNRGRAGDKERAQAAFEEALKIDPQLGAAAAEIAVLKMAGISFGVPMLEVLPEVRRWVDGALEIDPKSSRALAVRSEIEGGRTPESFERKLEDALKAATYGPRDGYAQGRLAGPLALFSSTLALEAARQASRVDPLVLTSPLFEAILLAGMYREDEAMERIDYALEIEPGMPFALLTKAIVLCQTDEAAALRLVDEELQPLADAGTLTERWVSLPRDFAALGYAVKRGQKEQAEIAAQRLASLARGEEPFPRWQQSTAGVPAQLAQFDRPQMALAVLKFRSQSDMLPPYEHLLLDPRFDALRSDAEFLSILEQARERFLQIVSILEEARARGELPPYLEQPLADLLARLRAAYDALRR